MRFQNIVNITCGKILKFVNIMALIMLFLALFDSSMLIRIVTVYGLFITFYFIILLPLYIVCNILDIIINVLTV